ncbi:MAG: efflux RND transporter periplasmic adaptor subunit [Bacteroidales bacterium]|nr:efflux RND transporter periplasmic adaptor subunit [Bacteroidales bacterium]
MTKKIIPFFLFSVFLWNCDFHKNNSHAESEDHSDDHTEIFESYTLYSENFELFFEYQPFISRMKNEFLAHYTRLKDFKPVTEGDLTIKIFQNKMPVFNNTFHLSKPGIFEPEIILVDTGICRIVFELQSKNMRETITIDSIKVFLDEESAEENQIATVHHEEIYFSKEQSWKIDFETQPISNQPFEDIIRTSGQIISAQGDEQMATANNQGNFFFTTLKLTPGSKVKKGDILGYVSGNRLLGSNTSQQFLIAKTEFEKAEADMYRAERLIRDTIITQKDYLQYKIKYEQSKQAYQLIADQFSREGIKIIAPKTGLVKELYVSNGLFLEAGSPILKIAENKRLLLRADLSQEYAVRIPEIISANFRLSFSKQIFETSLLNGEILSLGRTISSGYMMPVYIEIDNKDFLVPGSYADIWLKTTSKKYALLVPVSSILEEQGNYYVFVQLSGESFEKRYITVAKSNGKKTEVTGGLFEGERIVTKGAVNIKLASASSSLPSTGHVH